MVSYLNWAEIGLQSKILNFQPLEQEGGDTVYETTVILCLFVYQ